MTPSRLGAMSYNMEVPERAVHARGAGKVAEFSFEGWY